METTSPKNNPLRQKLLSAFRLLTRRNSQSCLEAVTIFQSACHDKGFAEMFVAMSQELDRTFYIVRSEQLSTMMSGVRQLGTPVAQLLILLARIAASPNDPRGAAAGLADVTKAMVSRDQVIAIGSFPAVFDMYLQASEQGRAEALSDLLETIVQFDLAKDFEAQLLHLMSSFTPAWAATAWMSFVKSGATLVKPEHHRRAAQAFLVCTPNEGKAVKTLEWLLCKQDQPDTQVFTPAEQQAMLARLVSLHRWPALLSLLNTYRAPLVCSLLFANEDLSFWDELANGDDARLLGRALGRARSDKALRRQVGNTISLLIEHCIASQTRNLHAVRELMLGLCEGLHDDEDDWDNLLTLVELLLDSESITELGFTLASCLWQLDLFSSDRKRRLFDLGVNWVPVQKLRYMARLIRGVRGHVGRLAWQRLVAVAKLAPLDDPMLVEQLVCAAFTQSATWQPAPDDVAAELLELLCARPQADCAGILVRHPELSAAAWEWLHRAPAGRAALLQLLKDPQMAAVLARRTTKVAPQLLGELLTSAPLSPTGALLVLCEVMAMADKPAQTAAAVVDALRHLIARLAQPMQKIATLVLNAAAPATHAASGPVSADPILAGFKIPLSKVLQCIHLLSNDRQWARIANGRLQEAQRDMYLAALVNAATEGSLKSMALDPQGSAWQKGFPKINWDYVFHGNAAALPPGSKLVGPTIISVSPDLGRLVTDWTQAMLAVAGSLLNETMGNADRRKTVVDALAPHLKPLLMALMCKAVPGLATMDATHLDELIKAATQGRHPDRLFDNDLFDRLLAKEGGVVPAIVEHAQALLRAGRTLMQKPKGKDEPDCVTALAKAFAKLQELAAQPRFRQRIRGNFGCYTLETFDKDDVTCLLASPSINIDLAPWKALGHLLVAALAGPVVFAGARGSAGELVALAICPVCTCPGYADEILLCDSIHLGPVCFPDPGASLSPAGSLILDGLLDHLVRVAPLVGASKCLITNQYQTWFNVPAPGEAVKIDAKQIKVVAGADELLLPQMHSASANPSFYDLAVRASHDADSAKASSSTPAE